MGDLSLSLKGDIVSCTVDKSDVSSEKIPNVLSNRSSKLNSTSQINNNDACGTDNIAVTEERPVEANTEDLEPALRRSKRGKGRPSNTQNSNSNNDAISDDHVPSCIVSGTEYHTEPEFEYYTIGLIEEIKVSRRDKFSIFIKCFYRTRDIPEISKQGLPDRDNYPVNSNVKLIRDIFARELFVSEVQETLPAKQLRGVCKVNYLPDLKTVLSTFSPEEDDNFFYVGQAYQASLPEFRHPPPALYRFGISYRRRRFRLRKHRRKAILPTSYKSDQDTNTPRHCFPRKILSMSPHYHRKCRYDTTPATIPTTTTTTTTINSDNHDTNSVSHLTLMSTLYNDAELHTNDQLLSNVNVNCTADSELKSNLESAQNEGDLLSNVQCKTETFTTDLSKDMKYTDDTTESVIGNVDLNNDAVLMLNLPPKLENANDFQDDPPDTRTTAMIDYSHHKKYNSPMHKNHSLCSAKQLHLNKRRRRCQRGRQSQLREILIWSPGGLSIALSGTSEKLNFHDSSSTNMIIANNNTIDLLNGISSDFNSMLSDEPLKNYLDAVRSMVAFFGFGGAEDDLSSAENGLVLANLAATTQHAYDTLHKCNYSLRNALQAISCNPIVAKDTPRHWTADQVRLFAHGLRIHGKDFFKIQRNFFGGKTLNNNNDDNNNNTADCSQGNNLNCFGVWNSHQVGTGRLRGGRGRRKLGGGDSSLCSGTSALSKTSVLKSGDIDNGSMMTMMVSSKLDEVKSEDVALVSTSEPLHDGGESVENSVVSGSTLKASSCNGTDISSSGLPAIKEPVKTVKELIAFYYYWKRKGTSSSAIGGGHGGLSSAAANFATAVVAAALNTDTTNNSNICSATPASGVSSSGYTTTSFESANNPNGTAFSSQAHINSGFVKKRKPTNRGCVLNYCKSTLINDDKSESIDPSQPESEIEENYDFANPGPDDIDTPVTSTEKGEERIPISTTSNGNTDSLPSSRPLRKRLCRNCNAELESSTGESSPSPMPHYQSGQLRFLCPDCRIHLQKYGELKCTVEKEMDNLSVIYSIREIFLSTTQEDEGTQKDYPSEMNSLKYNPIISTTKQISPLLYRKHKKYLFHRSKHESGYRHTDNDDDSSTSLSSSPSSTCSLNCLHMGRYYPASTSSVTSLSSSPRSSQFDDDSDFSESDYQSGDSFSSVSSCKSPLKSFEHNSYHLMKKRKRKGSHVIGHLPEKSVKHINDVDYLHKPPPKLDDNREYDYKENDLVDNNQSFSIQNKAKDALDHLYDSKIVLQSSEILSSSNLVDSRDTKGHISNVLYSNNIDDNFTGQKHSISSKLLPSIDISNNGNNHRLSDKTNELQHDVYVDDGDDSTSELEINQLISATNESNPLSCFIDAHRSTWSHLVRIWNRQTQYSYTPAEIGYCHSTKSETNVGSCARTDLVYCGRGLDMPMSNREFWNLQKRSLFAKYSDTAVGPGVNLYLSPGSCNLDGRPTVVSETIKQEPINLISSTVNYTGNTSFANIPSQLSPGIIHDTSSAALDLCARSSKRSYISSSSSCSSEQPCTKSRRSFQNEPVPNPYLHSTTLNTQNTINTTSGIFSSSASNTSLSQILPPASLPGGIRPTANNISNQQQQQLQTMYEQALIFAAAAAGHYQHSPPIRDTCKFFPPNFDLSSHSKQVAVVSSPNLRFLNPNINNNNNSLNTTNPLMSPRLGGATGTFYPPISSLSTPTGGGGGSLSLSSTTNNNSTYGMNRPSSIAPFNFNLTDPVNLPTQYMNMSASDGRSTPIHLSNSVTSVGSGYNGLGSSSNSLVPGNQFYNHPEFLRQLALMGLIPPGSVTPEQLMSTISAEQREIDTFQRLMTERLECLKNATNVNQQRTLTPVEQYQLYQQQQQQELLAAAFSAEMASRLEGISSSIYPHQNSLFPSSLSLPHCEGNGAMTSAVNSISTRPTASIQLPQNTRYPQSLQCTAALPTRFASGHTDIHNINKTPPIAHHNSAYSSSRDIPSNLNVNVSPLSSNVVPIRAPPHIPFTTPISHGNGGRSTGRNSTSQSTSSSNLQEQVFNAAKLAMMAANMQSDPNKALTFASLAAAAFTEMASSQDKKVLSRNDHQLYNPSSSGIQESLSQRNMNVPTSNVRLRSPVGQYNSDCNNNNNIPTPSVMSNFASQSTHKERRRQNSHLNTRNISQSPGPTNRLQSPGVHCHSESRPVGNRTPTPATNRMHQSLPGNDTLFPGQILSGGGLPTAQLAQLAHLAQMSGLPSGFSFQDPAVLNAFALAAAATSLVAGGSGVNHQSDILSETNVPNPIDRYRSPISSHTSPQQQRHPTSAQQQQQKAAAVAAAAMTNAFGLQNLPGQFNSRLSSSQP
ncbi:Arginine-glutamic acid dipeptide repeats protein [Schistosoma japonicum]|nr:Arginine-glutamic acid dipeptide repeats protein [Schistosoma japonicum]